MNSSFRESSAARAIIKEVLKALDLRINAEDGKGDASAGKEFTSDKSEIERLRKELSRTKEVGEVLLREKRDLTQRLKEAEEMSSKIAGQNEMTKDSVKAAHDAVEHMLRATSILRARLDGARRENSQLREWVKAGAELRACVTFVNGIKGSMMASVNLASLVKAAKAFDRVPPCVNQN